MDSSVLSGRTARSTRLIAVKTASSPIIVQFARLRAAVAAPEEAERLANEALLIATRSGYVMQTADAHLVLAGLALARHDFAGLRDARPRSAAARHLRWSARLHIQSRVRRSERVAPERVHQLTSDRTADMPMNRL